MRSWLIAPLILAAVYGYFVAVDFMVPGILNDPSLR